MKNCFSGVMFLRLDDAMRSREPPASINELKLDTGFSFVRFFNLVNNLLVTHSCTLSRDFSLVADVSHPSIKNVNGVVGYFFSGTRTFVNYM
jgi:hypothetical protein